VASIPADKKNMYWTMHCGNIKVGGKRINAPKKEKLKTG